MNKYAYIENEIVVTIYDEFDETFPNVPREQRFDEKFINNSVLIKETDIVEVGYSYVDGVFSPPPPPTAEEIAYQLEQAKNSKITEIKTELNNVLNTGTTYQDKNYSLNVQKRNEIEQYKQFTLWGNSIKYYADDNTFKTFTSSEFLEMAKFLQGFILENELHTLYLSQDINDMTMADQVNVINYNSELSTARQTILDNDIAEYNASTYETTGQMMTREEIAKLDYLAEIQSGGV